MDFLVIVYFDSVQVYTMYYSIRNYDIIYFTKFALTNKKFGTLYKPLLSSSAKSY